MRILRHSNDAISRVPQKLHAPTKKCMMQIFKMILHLEKSIDKHNDIPLAGGFYEVYNVQENSSVGVKVLQ